MTDQRKAMQAALEALETCRIRSVSEWEVTDVTPKNIVSAIEGLRAALAQPEPEPEPVAWGQLGLRNGKSYLRMNYDSLSGYPPSAHTVRNLNLVPLYAAPVAQPEPERCEYCNDTGDVHGPDGEWIGVCNCPAGQALRAIPVAWIIRVERALTGELIGESVSPTKVEPSSNYYGVHPDDPRRCISKVTPLFAAPVAQPEPAPAAEPVAVPRELISREQLRTLFGPGPFHVEQRTNAHAEICSADGRAIAQCSLSTDAGSRAGALCALLNLSLTEPTP